MLVFMPLMQYVLNLLQVIFVTGSQQAKLSLLMVRQTLNPIILIPVVPVLVMIHRLVVRPEALCHPLLCLKNPILIMHLLVN